MHQGLRAGLIAFLLAPLAACQSVSLQEPARLSSPPSQACIAQLSTFASQTAKRPVTLTDQAFAQSDQLLLERPNLRGPDGKLLDGRSLERPESFRLARKAGVCTVTHANSGQRADLSACTCTAHQ
jgi:hypothetical protein